MSMPLKSNAASPVAFKVAQERRRCDAHVLPRTRSWREWLRLEHRPLLWKKQSQHLVNLQLLFKNVNAVCVPLLLFSVTREVAISARTSSLIRCHEPALRLAYSGRFDLDNSEKDDNNTIGNGPGDAKLSRERPLRLHRKISRCPPTVVLPHREPGFVSRRGVRDMTGHLFRFLNLPMMPCVP
jgi:hypothetical protein